MPFASYTYMTDADAGAIKAYLFTLNPVHAPAPQNTLSFPFNQRALMGIWALMFNPDKRFEPRTARDAQWNRGAYLVEAMSHCGECHTPRNLLQALDNREKFSGAVQAGWRAYNITSDPKSGIGAWSETDLVHYLAVGHADGRGTATGPMGEAVDNSLQYLTQSDITAMVAYLRSVSAIATSDLPEPKAVAAPASYAQGVAANVDLPGKAVYAGACAGCHDWTGVSPVIPYATLTGVRSVNDPTATNVVQIILSGAHRQTSDAGATMPAFGTAYSDEEIASLANYVTARFGAQPSAVTAQNIATLRAQN
jgi:mono/diheme cytochrome c family protein